MRRQQDAPNATTWTVYIDHGITVRPNRPESPPSTVLVPEVRLRDLPDAISIIRDAGLVLGRVTETSVSNSGDDNSVQSQSPAAGKPADTGSAVDLVVGRFHGSGGGGGGGPTPPPDCAAGSLLVDPHPVVEARPTECP
jgi:hypothetical protein